MAERNGNLGSETMNEIALNFYPLKENDFTFDVYRASYVKGSKLEDSSTSVWALPDRRGEPEGSYSKYRVSFSNKPGFNRFRCTSGDNLYLTIAYLRHIVAEKCRNELGQNEYIIEKGYLRRIYFVLQRFKKGNQCVWLEPYLLRRTGQFGYLADFEFRLAEHEIFDREVQRLSLSLDDDYRENRDFYLDRFKKLKEFTSMYFHKLFPITLSDGENIEPETTLLQTESSCLDTKVYVFHENETAKSQFIGVRQHGPLERLAEQPQFLFVYRQEDRAFGHVLYRALKGETFRSFPGMDEMFGIRLDSDSVKGIPVEEYTKESIHEIVKQAANEGSERLIPVLLVPWDKETATKQESRLYYLMKHAFLMKSIPIQVVSLSTIRDRQTLKWASSNIGLALFAKLGGIPWKIQAPKENGLIIGIGQSHEWADGGIRRYFGYSVLTDASGIYDRLEILGRAKSEEEYIRQFRRRLGKVVARYKDEYERITIHSTFTLRKSELESIKGVLEEHEEKQVRDREPRLVAMKFNDKNKYFGYAPKNNSLVPYESSYLQICDDEFLVWFEGLQFHRPNITRRIGGPMHIEFIYPHRELAHDLKLKLLQDGINLSGANWRGFNAKAMPISVYYAYQLAKYFKAFSEVGLQRPDLSGVRPWFL